MKILIVDATNNFIRNYAVVPTLSGTGEPNGGVIGFLRSLGLFARTFESDKIILIWDGPGGSSKRKAILKDYKEGRKPIRINRNYDFERIDPERNKIKQRLRLAEYLKDLPVIQLSIPDVEADDVVGYLVKYYNEDEKIIVSNDKDFYQLISNKVQMYSPTKKEFITPDYLLENFGIPPVNFALARAIVGDESDNIKGVKGVGFKNLIKYFPFMSEQNKVTPQQLIDYASQQTGKKEIKKYERFTNCTQLVIDNYQIMQLESPIMSVSSIRKIREGLEKKIGLNATSFRIKLYEDGITTINDSFFQPFRILYNKGK